MDCCGNQVDCKGEITVTIQINGKKITTMKVPANICKEPLKALAAENDEVFAQLGDRMEKDIILEGKEVVNFIV